MVLSPSDALALRRDYHNNFELYIQKLRTDIEQQQMTIQKISSASSKSDAVILELRSTIRQYKRQLEKLQQAQTVDHAVVSNSNNNNNDIDTNVQSAADVSNPQSLSDRAVQNHPLVMELTDQLHDYQNKLMTADLIRKELEDTIEAEQYTWELRVQDLEREVQELKSSAVVPPPPTTSRSADLSNNTSSNIKNNTDESQEFRKQLEDAQNEIQRYRSIIMTTTTTSENIDEDVNQSSSMNTDASLSNTNNIQIWKEKVSLLEQERMELQGCLDEALKELEAVDLELQQEDTNNTLRDENERLQNIIQQLQQSPSQRTLPDVGTNDTVMEQLQHLYRWLLERDGSDESIQQSIRMMPQKYRTVEELIRAIQEHIDQQCTSVNRVQELERQISVHQGDIHAKEEETTEIRNSLKEAVSLLRPIQDSLAKLEKEKGKYQESIEGLQSQQEANLLEIRKYKQLINDKDDEIDQMKQNVESLEIQLSKAKLAVASTVVAQHNLGNSNTSRSVMMMDLNNDVSSPSEALDEKRAKRRTGENNLKELLRDATLRGDTGDASERDQQLRTIQEYEKEILLLRDELAKNDERIQSLQLNLTNAQDELITLQQQRQVNAKSGADQLSTSQLQQAEIRVQRLEEELQDTKRALASKRDAERSLNKSLKDALGLIKPLQVHLEESEMEKRQIAQELEALMKQQQSKKSLSNSLPNGSGGNDISNAVSVEVVKELETTVRQLEKENAMLQDALEDMSQSLNASHISGAASPNNKILSSIPHPSNNIKGISNKDDTRLHQEFVELQSRYEVTQTRLKDAYHENHTLSELVQQEQDEKFMLHDEVSTLREQLQKQAGGSNAKSSISIK